MIRTENVEPSTPRGSGRSVGMYVARYRQSGNRRKSRVEEPEILAWREMPKSSFSHDRRAAEPPENVSSSKPPKNLSLRCSSSVSSGVELTTQHSLAGTQQRTDALIPVYVMLGEYTDGEYWDCFLFSTVSTRRMRGLTADVLPMLAVYPQYRTQKCCQYWQYLPQLDYCESEYRQYCTRSI